MLQFRQNLISKTPRKRGFMAWYVTIGLVITAILYCVEDAMNGGNGNGFNLFFDELGWNIPGGKARRAVYAKLHTCGLDDLPGPLHFWGMMSLPILWLPLFLIFSVVGLVSTVFYGNDMI